MSQQPPPPPGRGQGEGQGGGQGGDQGQGPYSPQQYQQYQQYQPTQRPDIPNYLVQAILTTVFCCLPAGIVSIVYAAQVNGKVGAGDISGAMDASRKAKMWAWISFGAGLATIVIYLVVAAAVGGFQATAP